MRREALGENEFEAARREGGSLTFREAVDYALADKDPDDGDNCTTVSAKLAASCNRPSPSQ